MASQLARAEERERRRIAEGLHDHVVQALAMAKMTLGVVAKHIPEAQKSAFAESMKLINIAMQDLRTLVFELSPPMLYELGLAPAVEWLAEQLHRRHNIKVSVKSHGSFPERSQEMDILFYQLIRELLINVVKHAKATEATVHINIDGRRYSVVVVDNGQGLDPPESADGSQGFGLFNIRNRLEQIGGFFEVQSVPHKGTRIILAVPPPPSGTSE
jgi:signal transduction histidine kinase